MRLQTALRMYAFPDKCAYEWAEVIGFGNFSGEIHFHALRRRAIRINALNGPDALSGAECQLFTTEFGKRFLDFQVIDLYPALCQIGRKVSVCVVFTIADVPPEEVSAPLANPDRAFIQNFRDRMSEFRYQNHFSIQADLRRFK